MERIGLVSVTWERGGTRALVPFTAPAEEQGPLLRTLVERCGLEEAVYLATCNRVEVVFVAPRGVPLRRLRPPLFEALTGTAPRPGEAERLLRAWAGEGAVEHVLLVASGLASARVGETEILGQVRRAFELARKQGLTGPRLELLFEQALRIGKRVRSRLPVDGSRASLAESALDHVRARLGRTPGACGLLGVSDMTRRIAAALREQGTPIVVVNRTRERARELAGTCGGRALSLEELRQRPPSLEALVTATGAADPVLGRAEFERLAARTPSGEPPLVVDLGVPGDVDAAAAREAGVPLVDMDAILQEAGCHRSRRLQEAAEARELVDDALDGFRRRLSERVLAPVLAALQRRYRETAEVGADRLLRRELASLDGPAREAVLRWAVTLARRLAHVPVRGLRGLGGALGPEVVEAFVRGTEDDVLRAALEPDPDGWTLPEEGSP